MGGRRRKFFDPSFPSRDIKPSLSVSTCVRPSVRACVRNLVSVYSAIAGRWFSTVLGVTFYAECGRDI